MAGRFSGALAGIATVFAALAIVRLTDAVGKKELVRASQEVAADNAAARRERDDLERLAGRMAEDEQFLDFRIASFSKREPYLIIDRATKQLAIAVQDKNLFESAYRVRGPEQAREALAALPRSTLEVIGVRTNTDWYKPDWYYRLEGVQPPADSAERLVKNAFGAGEVFLGGDIVIHGRAFDGIPPEAVDHGYIELDEPALLSVLDAAKPGTLVFIR